MSGHTKGPWFRIPGHSTVWADEKKSSAVCVMASTDYDANANLIAAVPDLLEALERIAREHDCGCVPCTGSCRSKEALEITVEEIQEIARSAIAKARGAE